MEKIVHRPVRRKLPDERQSITHKFSIGGHEGYITVGLYEDGSPGEVFISMAKEGSTISGLMDSFATAVSYALQYGVPLKFFVDKFSHVRFEPSGWTGNAGTVREVDHGLHLPLAGRQVPGPEYGIGRGRRYADVEADGAESAAGSSVRSRRRRCAIVRRMRVDHDSKWLLLQVWKLRWYQRLQLTLLPSRCCSIRSRATR